MSKNPENNNVFSTLGATNHSTGERQKEDGTFDKDTKIDWIRYK
jgi:hypothetical protein